jgi:hypothetical protein
MKRLFLRRFMLKMMVIILTKTGSGQTFGNAQGERVVSCRTGTLRSDATVKGAVVSVFAKGAYGGSAFNGTRCEKRPFSSHLNVKNDHFTKTGSGPT